MATAGVNDAGPVSVISCASCQYGFAAETSFQRVRYAFFSEKEDTLRLKPEAPTGLAGAYPRLYLLDRGQLGKQGCYDGLALFRSDDRDQKYQYE